MTARDIYTVAGNGGNSSGAGQPPTAAEFGCPGGISASGTGGTAFTACGPPDNNKVDFIPARRGRLFGQNMTAGRLYAVGVKLPFRITGSAPMAVNFNGNLVVAGGSTNKVWVIAARSGRFFGQAMTTGHYYAIAGTGKAGFTGDRGPALKARLSGPSGVAIDRDGNVLIIDTNNHRIRVLASSTGTFYGQKMKAGDIYTLAGNGTAAFKGDGGPATAAGMSPGAVATDPAGNLVLTEGSDRILVVAARTATYYGEPMIAGHIYTIAGTGTAGFSGDGGPATAAEFSAPGGIAVDRAGNVIFSDTVNNVVWAIAASTGTYYGQAMTAGDIYIVAGGGTTILGDGGPATLAQLTPVGVAISATGSLLITDPADNRVRAVSP
jgi:hypothetical protein